jgi:uncharacterized membrane protein
MGAITFGVLFFIPILLISLGIVEHQINKEEALDEVAASSKAER